MRRTIPPSSRANTQDSENNSNRLDAHMQPSTSMFTIAGKEPEKIMKRARIFLDEKQKTKSRAQSLWSFMDATNTFDQAKFFQEHAEQVFQVVFETCMQQIAKIKNKSERLQSWNSKDLVNLQKTLSLLRKIFLYVPELMRSGWQRQNIALVLSHVLDHGNHPRLRSLGFHLLLLWLNDQITEYPECIELFSNAISLDLFVLDDIQPYNSTNTNNSTNSTSPQAPTPMHSTTHLKTPHHYENEESAHSPQKLHTSGLHFVKKLRESHAEKHSRQDSQRDAQIKGSGIEFNQKIIFSGNNSHSAPLFPNPVHPTFHDSVALIHIFINNLIRLAFVASGSTPPPDEYDYPPCDYFERDDGIAVGVGIDAATASAKFLFKLFRTHYMTKFVPLVSKSLQTQSAVDDKVYGFSNCPPSILRSILKFLIGYCLDNENLQPGSCWSHNTSCSSPATPILKSIVLSSHETREMLHEMIRQSLILPNTNSSYRDIIRGGVHILGVWMLGSEEDRPSFLRGNNPVTRSSSIGSVTAVSISMNESPVQRVFSSSPLGTPVLEANKVLTNDENTDANSFLRRYLLMIKLVFFQELNSDSRERRAVQAQLTTNWDDLVRLYKDTISVYRALSVSKSGIELEPESWELMLSCLLEIQQGFMNQPEKYSRIPVQSLADELADYLSETLLHAFVRAKIFHSELWETLKNQMIASIRWSQALNQWMRVMQKLTRLLSSKLYKVEYELHPDTKYRLVEDSSTTANKRHSAQYGSSNNISNTRFSSTGSGRSRVKSRRLSLQCSTDQQDPAPEGSVSSILRNISNGSLSDIANTFKSDRKSTFLPSVMDEEDEGGEASESSPMFPSSKRAPLSAGSAQSSSGYSTYASNSSLGKKSATNTSVKSGNRRRTVSVHQLDALWHDSSSKLLNLVHHADSTTQSNNNRDALAKNENKKCTDGDHQSTASIEEKSTHTSATATSNVMAPGEFIFIAATADSVNGKLPPGLASFKTAEFLILSNLSYDGKQILSIWKNMLLVMGNINLIKGSYNFSMAMNCVVETWDTLMLVRARQPYNDVEVPSLYEVAPWLFQAAELSSEYVAGKAAAYGSLCRLMTQTPEEKLPDGYHAAFYHTIIKGLFSKDNAIVQSIITNSECLFGSPLPSVHILIPSFIGAIENQLFDGDMLCQKTSDSVKKSCVTILSSLTCISNCLKQLTISQDDMIELTGNQQSQSFSFANVKLLLKDVLTRMVNSALTQSVSEENMNICCLALNTLCVLGLDELLTSESPQHDFIYDCISLITNHLYYNSISVINTVVDCLEAITTIYKEEIDPERLLIQEIISKLIDALTVHLQRPKELKYDRGYIISRLFGCLIGWVMCIEPILFTETDLCRLIFNVIDLALNVSVERYEKRFTSTSQSEHGKPLCSFSLPLEKRPSVFEHLIRATSSELSEKDQEYIKESAEAVLLHFLNHFNNFAPSYGPETFHTTIIGPGVSQDDQGYYNNYQYFYFNETTIIAFAELLKQDAKDGQARVIIRDLTGRYAWDSKLEPNCETNSVEKSTEKIQDFNVRPSISIMQSSEERLNETNQEKKWPEDPFKKLLKRIGESHPDCLLTSSLLSNIPTTPTSIQLGICDRVTEYLVSEKEAQLQEHASDVEFWYSKVITLRQKELEKVILKRGEPAIQLQLLSQFSSKKELVPAFPQEFENSSVPFQQNRLFMSHMGFISYDQLKGGAFQMLKKTPALFRDLRSLDRKHGREIMKIGLLYVAHGQEDELAILQNSQGSERYNAFVNSLGWEVDIATHSGYLGGLERNLTNGRKSTYYCSSTLEIIFHDVTKMPTDTSDPKQLKKKRHIGNDHVHIVWNEHDRDYRFDTIGGDFGNAQIVVTPLPDNLYSIRVYRDLKIPNFGPLVDRMIVSQPILGSLVRSTAISAFRACLHTNLYSFYKCIYAQRANDIRTITDRHKVDNWDYEQFMEKIFMPEEL